MSPAHARLCLLEGFSLDRPGRGYPVAALPHGVQRLLAYLGLAGRPARSAVAGELWPDVCQPQADRNLRSALWRLQKAVPGLVESAGGALALADGVAVDVRELSAWAGAVLEPPTGPGPAELSAAVEVPDVARRGDLLPGWYDEWVLLERERLRQLRVYALETLADRLGQAGRFAGAVQAAYAVVRAEPLRESGHRTLIRVHLAEGNAAEALRAYECYRELLAGELGITPSARMLRLVDDALIPARTPARA